MNTANDYLPIIAKYAPDLAKDKEKAMLFYVTCRERLIGFIKRCYNTNCKDYPVYSKIAEPRVAKEWMTDDGKLSFLEFCLKLGFHKDTTLTFNRIHGEYGYCPDNLELIPKSENEIFNAEYIKASHIFKYADCNLYLTLRQRGEYLGFSTKITKRTKRNYENLYYLNRYRRYPYMHSQKDLAFFRQISRLNKKYIDKGLCKYFGIYPKGYNMAMDVKTKEVKNIPDKITNCYTEYMDFTRMHLGKWLLVGLFSKDNNVLLENVKKKEIIKISKAEFYKNFINCEHINRDKEITIWKKRLKKRLKQAEPTQRPA